jgi:predicted AAA+ superfamily ATPase
MNISKQELITVLAQFNPWWRGEHMADLPEWQRSAWRELDYWVRSPPVHRAILLSGARQVGKTTLLLQQIERLLQHGVPAANILYATFDHPLLKLAGIDAVLQAWREREPRVSGPEYLLLDEAQFIRDWGTWVKHQIDFDKQRRIVFTGSAMPLVESEPESGVGRWHTIRLATLSFFEYLQLKQLGQSGQVPGQTAGQTPALPELPKVASIAELFDWSPQAFQRCRELAAPYVGHFHEYLMRGGFPQTAQLDSITQAQRLLREDIIDKALKRDMTALFGVRRILDLEHTFLYLCMHDGGLLNISDLSNSLEVKRPTAQHFIELLEACHLIYRLPPHGQGKEVLKGRSKVYLADAAIASAVLLKGKSMLDDPIALGVATETAVFKHLLARYQGQNLRFTWWHGKGANEVDLLADNGRQLVPFEVKYRNTHTGQNDLKGLFELCRQKPIERAYVITKSLDDFGLMADLPGRAGTRIDHPNVPSMRIDTRILYLPAPLLCWFIGASEFLIEPDKEPPLGDP